jgi:hypothetical protein
MEYSSISKKLIGRVLLNSEDERTGALQTIFETTEGKIKIIRHDATLRAAWARGDLEPGNVVTIDSLRSDPGQLYASTAGKGKDILRDGKALDSIVRRISASISRTQPLTWYRRASSISATSFATSIRRGSPRSPKCLLTTPSRAWISPMC